jgi:hypothetical protein
LLLLPSLLPPLTAAAHLHHHGGASPYRVRWFTRQVLLLVV